MQTNVKAAARYAPLLSLFALTCASCGTSHEPVYQVTGTVLFNGKPAAGAVVVFHPAGESKGLGVHPQGSVGADGSVQLTTFEQNDGAPAGQYDVAVTWTKPIHPGEKDEVSLLPIRYLRPQSSGLHAQVKPEAINNLAPFELKP
jgi:hypothetical protein